VGERPPAAEIDELHVLLDAGRFGEAFELLAREYASIVTSYVGRRVPPDRRDDLIQDVWLAAREALPRYRRDCAPAIWLRVIARNKVIDAWRDRPELVSLHSTMASAPEVAKLAGARMPSTPTGKLARAEDAAALGAALVQLDADDRELLALRFLEDLSPAEIAVIVDARPNAVSQRIVRAVRRLRELMS
jgi:RNA polymerase sigma-70 factor, ECF subfamily